MKLTIHLAALVAAVSLMEAAEPDRFVRGGLTILNLILPGPGHPRNSEGAFVALKDGRILFAYSKFTSGGTTPIMRTLPLATRATADRLGPGIRPCWKMRPG